MTHRAAFELLICLNKKLEFDIQLKSPFSHVSKNLFRFPQVFLALSSSSLLALISSFVGRLPWNFFLSQVKWTPDSLKEGFLLSSPLSVETNLIWAQDEQDIFTLNIYDTNSVTRFGELRHFGKVLQGLGKVTYWKII